MEQIKEKYAVGMDVGGSHVAAVVVDLSTGDMCGTPVEVPVDSSCNADYILDMLAQCISAAITASGVDPYGNFGSKSNTLLPAKALH